MEKLSESEKQTIRMSILVETVKVDILKEEILRKVKIISELKEKIGDI